MGRVNYKGEVYESKEVVSKLVDFLTPERLEKINRVVGQRSDGFIAVLENLYDRGNVSAVMRSSEAFGFYKIHVIQTDKAFKESKRVTQGADKWLEVDKWSETQSCVEFLKNHGYTVLTTSLNDDDNKNDNNKNDGNKNGDNKDDAIRMMAIRMATTRMATTRMATTRMMAIRMATTRIGFLWIWILIRKRR